MKSLSARRTDWTADEISPLGRALYEAVPSDKRPLWATAILRRLPNEEASRPEIQRLVAIASDRNRWREAYDAFQAVRQLTLENERKGLFESRNQMFLNVAETTAKIIYNASGGPAPFDFHAGWRLGPRVKRFTDDVKDPELEEECWKLLIAA